MVKMLVGDTSLMLTSKLNEYVDDFLEYRDDFNYVSMDFELDSFEDIIECLQTPAFGSLHKVVVCKNPYFFSNEKVKLTFINKMETLENYLYSQNEDALLIIVCNKKYYSPKNKYYTMIAKLTRVDTFLFENKNELNDYAEFLFSKSKVDISQDAIDELTFRCEDVSSLEREIAKLVLYGDTITRKNVEEMVPRPLEDDIFALSNALLKRNHQDIMQIYNDLKLLKVEPINLIAMLSSQFRLLLSVAILKKEHKDENEIATILNVHPYRVKLSVGYLKQYDIDEVRKILIDLADLDEQIKNGQKDRYIDFELFLATK